MQNLPENPHQELPIQLSTFQNIVESFGFSHEGFAEELRYCFNEHKKIDPIILTRYTSRKDSIHHALKKALETRKIDIAPCLDTGASKNEEHLPDKELSSELLEAFSAAKIFFPTNEKERKRIIFNLQHYTTTKIIESLKRKLWQLSKEKNPQKRNHILIPLKKDWYLRRIKLPKWRRLVVDPKQVLYKNGLYHNHNTYMEAISKH